MAGSIPGSAMSDVWGRFLKHGRAVAGVGLILALMLLALSARQVAPHDPLRQDLPHALARPSLEFPLGTDEFGRCILSRILFGARLSLLVGVIATAIGAGAGILSGLAAGYFPRPDAPVMRTMDVLLAFPSILLAIAIVAALGPSLGNVMIAVGVRSIPRLARLAPSRLLVHAGGHSYPARGDPVLSRPGRPAAHARVGQDGERRARLPPRSAPRVALPRPRHLHRGGGLQLPRCWPARRARSARGPGGRGVRRVILG